MSVMFTNHSEHPIHVRKREYLSQARTLIFSEKLQEMKEVINSVNLIIPGARIRISVSSEADPPLVENEETLALSH